MKQAAAVVNATLEVLGNSFDHSQPILSYITKAQIEQVVDFVTAQIIAGEVEFGAKDKYDTDAKVRAYTKGMVNNWHRKSLQLNPTKYEAKNPGSRAGSSDPMVREMKKLKAQLEAAGDLDTAQEVQAQIDARIQEVKPSKPTPTINESVLPESLRHLVKKTA
jgi:hypothetical protein